MAFLLQDDNGTVDGANAYVSVVEFRDYHDTRGADTAVHADGDVEKAIVRATDFLDTRYKFAGVQVRRRQGTQFPRYVSSRQLTIQGEQNLDGYVREIPREVKFACSLLALRVLGGATLLPDPTFDASGQAVQSTSKKVGSIEVSTTFASATGGSSGAAVPRYPDVDLLLRNAGLLAVGGSVVRS